MIGRFSLANPACWPEVQYLNRYRLTDILGESSFGVIHAAEDTVTRREVAIKVLRFHLKDPLKLSCFEREGRILSSLHHPHIVEMTDSGPDFDLAVRGKEGAPPLPFLAMERRGRLTLKTLMVAYGPLAWPQAGTILSQVASALSAVHAIGIVHRDLKPQNILLEGEGSLLAKLIDFGIALDLHDPEQKADEERRGVAIGTPLYMAPEQMEDCGIDHRADLYALGVLAYEMLTGQFPFEGSDYSEVAERQRRTLPTRPSDLVLSIPERAEEIILKALQKNPDERYQTADEMAAAIRAAS